MGRRASKENVQFFVLGALLLLLVIVVIYHPRTVVSELYDYSGRSNIRIEDV
jgi:hypothetical protein